MEDNVAESGPDLWRRERCEPALITCGHPPTTLSGTGILKTVYFGTICREFREFGTRYEQKNRCERPPKDWHGEQVGRILKVLEELGMADDTIVLFSSDHGDMLGSHGLRLKRKPWEESIRVPGIFRYPRRVSPGPTDVLLSHVDFAPTLLSLCGLKIPTEMQGKDVSPVLLGKTSEGPQSVFFQIFGPFEAGGVKAGWRGVRTERYMYARYQSQPWVLFDLEKDPYELRNLATDSAAATIRKEMEKNLTAWMKQTGDSWKNDWTFPVEDKGRLYNHETFYTVKDYLTWAKQHPELQPK